MNRFKIILRNFTHADHLRIRLPLVLLGVLIMSFSLSWLILVDWGTDPFTAMNLAISARLGMSLGNWQAIFNTLLFLIVILCGGTDIGYGTLANMILIGYLVDFFSWLWGKLLPFNPFMDNLPLRIAGMIAGVVVFVFAAALYMDGGLGVSPYDAIPFILGRRFPKIPMRPLRICYDLAACTITLLFGGAVHPATLLMALLLGPIIVFVGKLFQKKLPVSEASAPEERSASDTKQTPGI